MAQPPTTRPASSAPPCFPSWSGGPTRRLAPTLEALAAQPPGLRPGTASRPPPPATPPTPEAERCPGEGEHRRAPGRETKRPPRPEEASRGSQTYRSRGSLRRQPGSPQTPPKSPPRRDRGRPLSVSLSRGTEEELAGPPVPFPPPAHHPVTLWGGGEAPVPAEAAAPFPRNHVGGRRQRPPPPPQR